MATRCPKQYQGDRCRKGRGHDSSILLTPDPWHEGQFSRWNDKEVFPLSPPPRFHRRDLRQLKKALRSVDPKTKDPAERARGKHVLDQIVKVTRG